LKPNNSVTCPLCIQPAAAKKIPIKGVSTFQPCPAPGKQLLAAFIAESKGQPAVATVVDCSGDTPVTISRKSFYRATGARSFGRISATLLRYKIYHVLKYLVAFAGTPV
jgi:uncharacterized protein with WD repeat